MQPTIQIELGASEAKKASIRGDVIIIVDVLRASSTIVTALANGAKHIRPVSSLEECIGEVTAGERGGHKPSDFNVDNSPLSFLENRFSNKEIVLTTTNGTECINAANSALDSIVLIGSILNAQSVAESALLLAKNHKRNITIICAGRKKKMATEDLIGASEIASAIPSAPIIGKIAAIQSDDLVKDFLESDTGKNLESLGKTADILFCAEKNRYAITPICENGNIKVLSF